MEADTSTGSDTGADRTERREAEALLRQGRSVKQVAQAVGVSYLTAWYWRQGMSRSSRRADAEAMLRQGYDPPEVAGALGVSIYMVKAWQRALRLSGAQPAVPEPVPHPRRAEAEALLRTGKTIDEVAAALGLPQAKVRDWGRPLGLPYIQRRSPALRRHPKRAEAEALLREGHAPRDVAATLGVAAGLVREWRRPLGLPPLPRASMPARRQHPRRAEAEALLRVGQPPRAVAGATSVPLGRVYDWRRKLGLPPLLPQKGRPRHPRQDEVEALLREGRAPEEIVAATGVDARRVYAWRWRLGLSPRPRPRPPADKQAEAEALLRAGRTPGEVATATGVPLTRIMTWHRELGLPPPPRRPGGGRPEHPRRAEAQDLLRQGMPVPEVARRTGVSVGVVYQCRRELGLTVLVRRPHPRRAEAEALLRAGRNPRDVAAVVGVSPETVSTWRREMGLPPTRRPPTRPPRRRRTRTRHPRRDQAEALLFTGMSVKAVAGALELCPSTVQRWRGPLKLPRRRQDAHGR